MLDKRERLRELEGRMKKHFRRKFPESCLWSFSSENGVDGYLGVDPVMFVGIRPSTGKGGFAKPTLNAFYDLLKRHGFAHAHVTDLVKESMKVGYPSDEQIERNWPYFLEELAVVEPAVIVALGWWVFNQLKKRLKRPVRLVRVTHYSYRYGSREELKKRFDDEFEGLAKSLKRREGVINDD